VQKGKYKIRYISSYLHFWIGRNLLGIQSSSDVTSVHLTKWDTGDSVPSHLPQICSATSAS